MPNRCNYCGAIIGYPGKDRRHYSPGFGLASIRKEGGWNYEIDRGGIERRRDHPNYDGYWRRENA